MARTVCSGEQAGELFRAATSLSRNEKALLILRKHSEKANDTLARNQMLDFAFNSAIIQDQNLTPSKRVILTLAQNETLALNSAIKKDIKSELLVTRVWSASEHPQWVAFEMEGALQIRPAQYAIAQAVIDNPGAVVQLNMGLGKTRVIAMAYCAGRICRAPSISNATHCGCSLADQTRVTRSSDLMSFLMAEFNASVSF